MMKMRSKDATRRINDLRRDKPLGPGRMVELVRLLEEDAAGLPTIDAPADVVEARQGFEAACSWARGVANEIEAAGKAAAEAHAADVAATAAAMADGASRPKTSAAKSAEKLSGALVGVEAAERLLEEAHGRLVDAVHAAWASWRREAVAGAEGAHAAAREAMQEATEAVQSAQERYALVGKLDSEMLGRYPEHKAEAEAETRGPLNWYAETHNARRPLRVAAIPGQKVKGKPVTAELSAMLDSCRQAVEASAAFGPAEWLPPTDEGHAAALAEPLDLEAAWVRSAVGRASGTVCPYCLKPDADMVVEERGQLILVHAACERRAENDPKAKAKRTRQERIARYQREGWPCDPNTTEGEREERRRESASSRARDALYESGGISATPADYAGKD